MVKNDGGKVENAGNVVELRSIECGNISDIVVTFKCPAYPAPGEGQAHKFYSLSDK